jgi:hypothetical protein
MAILSIGSVIIFVSPSQQLQPSNLIVDGGGGAKQQHDDPHVPWLSHPSKHLSGLHGRAGERV